MTRTGAKISCASCRSVWLHARLNNASTFAAASAYLQRCAAGKNRRRCAKTLCAACSDGVTPVRRGFVGSVDGGYNYTSDMRNGATNGSCARTCRAKQISPNRLRCSIMGLMKLAVTYLIEQHCPTKLEELSTGCVWPEKSIGRHHHRLRTACVSLAWTTGVKISGESLPQKGRRPSYEIPNARSFVFACAERVLKNQDMLLNGRSALHRHSPPPLHHPCFLTTAGDVTTEPDTATHHAQVLTNCPFIHSRKLVTQFSSFALFKFCPKAETTQKKSSVLYLKIFLLSIPYLKFSFNTTATCIMLIFMLIMSYRAQVLFLNSVFGFCFCCLIEEFKSKAG